MAYLGIDIGSVSVKSARIAEDGTLLASCYRRHHGHPLEATVALLREELAKGEEIQGIGFTGGGGKKVAEALGAPFENEVVVQARAAAHLTPWVNSLIVVGGEDSFLLLLDQGGTAETVQIRDFAMNGLCAAGCGSFLDQQASRLGVNIEGEFSALALASTRPARVAGRCSVFAKSDMIHLQQQATPVSDIVAGLCFAFARNFSAVLARGKEFTPPVAFHGGVALNAGMVRAFTETLELAEDQFLVPEHAAVAGAVGAALLARKTDLSAEALAKPEHAATAGAVGAALPARKTGAQSVDLSALDALLAGQYDIRASAPPLPDPGLSPASRVANLPSGPPVEAYLGVDVGSISTNLVLIDGEKRVLAKQYLMTAGRPIEAVRQGLAAIGADFAYRVVVRGVCTTGSGRYLTGDFLGADLVKNEITTQARAAMEIDPEVDTIFEIGGQDSKYIRLEDGAIVDFEMNKVCAAGTGSFLEEQAERLGISIKDEFAELALASPAPVSLGERCTVFMESDLVGQQAAGAATGDLAAGLAYSIVQNYLNRVVSGRSVGERIFFQGGTAFNRAVVAAFRQVTGKPVTVPEHHEVTGAIGCALMALEAARPDMPSGFKGWDLSTRTYTQDSFECKGCANNCTINRVRVEGEQTLFYGGRCEKYEKRRSSADGIPDLFAEREILLMGGYQEGKAQPGRPLIGIPRTLHFSEYAPFWRAFFTALGLPVRFSSPTSRRTINEGLAATLAEFCFPVKVAHGHILELIEAGATHLFLPNIQQLPKPHDGYQESVPCPYVSSLPYTIRAVLPDIGKQAAVLAPVVELHKSAKEAARLMQPHLEGLGVTRRQVEKAVEAGFEAQQAFNRILAARGQEVLAGLPADATAVVIVSRPYNGCDNGINLEIPRRFRELGVLPIPMDMLPVDEIDLSPEFPDLTWRYGQKILAAADIIRDDPRLHAVYITNFGCGPDSFLLKFFRSRLGGKTFLQLEIDEHSSDVGAITRCEAFLDSLRKHSRQTGKGARFRPNAMPDGKTRTIYLPYMCDAAHALAAAFRSVGQPAEVLPESDQESAAIGKRHCTGKECFPCIVTTGDFVRFITRPETDPSRVAFFMPSVAGGCRFGYYNLLQRLVLDELGFAEVPIFSPNQSRGLYTSLSARAGQTLIRRAWQGIVAIELLEKALHHVRPAETTPGAADRAYGEFLSRTVRAIEAGADLAPVMREARAAFEAIPVGRDGLPWIGLIGEVFVRSHQYSNQHLIRQLEALGGKVWLAPLTEWLYYVNINQREDAAREKRWGEALQLKITDGVMHSDEHHLARHWEGFLPNAVEAPPQEAIEDGRRYIDPAFRGEAILGLGKARQFHRLGLAGVINIMPFTCMPGTITSGIFKRFQQEHDRMPVLNLAFEGQASTDLSIRLEAFIQQCRGYQERRKKE